MSVGQNATDNDVRAYLLGIDKERADISDKLRQLLDAGIEVHAQVVLCPEINDGDVLAQTIADLAEHYPRISSVAVVPLALTRYNTDSRLTPVSKEFCRVTVARISEIQQELHDRLGTNFVFLGDEIYLRAGLAVPDKKHYGSCPQIEDGVGMVRSFSNEFGALVRQTAKEKRHIETRRGTILTGELFAPILRSEIEKLNKRFGTDLKVAAVANGYFGGDVSVAGLLTGGDFLSMRKAIEGEFVLIPRSTLKSDEDIMLDGTTLAALTESLGLPVYPVDLQELFQLLFKLEPNRLN